MAKSAKDSERTPSDPATPTSQAGRIHHDSRGNAVWSWDKSSDPSSSTAGTSKMLRKLDLVDLRLEDTPAAEEASEAKKKGPDYGAGYNPYDRTAPVRIVPKKAPPR